MLKATLLALAATFLADVAGEPMLADETSARAFFDAHNARGEAFDVAVAEDYSDEAVISARRIGADGEDQQMQMTGTKFKMLVGTGMPLAQQRGDVSTYQDALFFVDGVRVTIRATRYAVAKCYLDNEYRQVIERQPDGDYLIVAEHFFNQAASNC